MRLRKVISLFALCVVLSGCAGRGFMTKSEVSALKADPVAESFTNRVVALPEGGVEYFAESPLGQVTIDAGTFYLSGLGNKCRSVRITRETIRYKAAVCREENDTWRFIPIIFESMP